jgi:drug/metabolite transporter (DMT)-like permease
MPARPFGTAIIRMHGVLSNSRAETAQKAWAISGLFSGTVVWGLIWYPYRLLEQAGVSGILSCFVTYSLPLVAGALVFRRALSQLRGAPPALLWLALASGWTNLAYVLSVIEGEVMRVLLLFYLAPLWTILFARFLLGERLLFHGYLVMLLSLGGGFIMLWQPNAGFPLPGSSAEWLGLSAGVTFALSNVLSRKAQDVSDDLRSLSVWGGVGLVTLLPLIYSPVGNSMPLAVVAHLSPAVWGLLLGLSTAIFLVTVIVQYGLARTPANQAIVIFLFELVVAAVSSYLLAGEALTGREWVGGAMIVVASLFSGKLEREG